MKQAFYTLMRSVAWIPVMTIVHISICGKRNDLCGGTNDYEGTSTRLGICCGVVPPQHSICSRLRSNPVGFEYCAFLRPAFVGVVKAVELLPQQNWI
jgi:hypothetical protein